MENIELGKDGLKISYRRYIADSSSGIILYLLIFFFKNWLFDDWFTFINDVPTELAVFLFLCLFFSATTVGGLISGLSWIILGNFFVPGYRWLFSKKFYSNRFSRVVNWFNAKNYERYGFNEYKAFLGLNAKNWLALYHALYRLSRFSSNSETNGVDSAIEAVGGNVTFIRNCSLFAIIAAIIFCWKGLFGLMLIALTTASAFFLVGLCEEVYLINNVFQHSHIFLIGKIRPTEIQGEFTNIKKFFLPETV